MQSRTPSPRYESEQSLPHDHGREERQPYAKELEDYKHGVAAPPKEQGAQEEQSTQEANPGTAEKRNKK